MTAKRDRNPAYDSTPELDAALREFEAFIKSKPGRLFDAAKLERLVKATYVERIHHGGYHEHPSYDLAYNGRARLHNIEAEGKAVGSLERVREFVVAVAAELEELGGKCQLYTSGMSIEEYARRVNHSWNWTFTFTGPENTLLTVHIKERSRSGARHGYSVSYLPTPSGIFDVRVGNIGGERFGSRKGVLPAAEIAKSIHRKLCGDAESKVRQREIEQKSTMIQAMVDEAHREVGITPDNGKWDWDPGRAHLKVEDNGRGVVLVLDKPLTIEQGRQLLKLCSELGV